MRADIGSPVLPALAWVVLLAAFLAQVEIQIEGAAGWAASLPTWRIEEHWLLDLFWGGRAMTGYHAWMFPFIALVFHFPFFFWGRWSWRAECRVLAFIMVFWIVEDFLWFVLNPAYGLGLFHPAAVSWHKHWVLGAPVEYWVFSAVAFGLIRLSRTDR
ncbi:hypothetical protein [Noviherbaspirillum aridicola]|uniref:Uncharacterized protein n=1 Tax=Noviherbaspirillum aridicola TaxID=2849687 RepID=A0ABQ4Q6K5_9BURK|nr:hypothetical protein [Noviherbaspirillum aridicola]GIZ52815.1 hypothetical protein NCCP691_28290 [Noviherbaspirillum aridicola]